MTAPSFSLNTLAAATLAALALPAWSQTADPAGSPADKRTDKSTTQVVITGNPLRRDDTAQPATVLTGDDLQRQRGATLGDTLDGLPGVAASGFGANASRPVIRGLDGDRVRLLDNGGASVDASNLSFDHAVAIDPLVIERLEVLRGPAALLYGGNATGGVVNTIDNRIPKLPADGLSGRAELRLGGAAAERAGAAVVEGGQGGASGSWAWHVDAFGRQTSDQRVPRYTPLEAGQPLADATRVRNSASQAAGAAVGASWLSGENRLGASIDTYDNDYGVTVEPAVTIRMHRERAALSGQWALDGPTSGWFKDVSLEASHTRYRHDEVDAGVLGTRFESRGDDLRVQLQQTERGPWRAAWGAQFEQLDFAALGDEAFVPATHTRSAALFTLHSWRVGDSVELSAGARGEQVSVASDGDTAGSTGGRFGAATERRFQPWSGSLGASWRLAPGWSLSGQLGHTERAPAYYELFANGVHVATGAYERGDVALGLERSRHVELGLQWKAAVGHQLKAQLFETRFANYIALMASGNVVDGVPEYVFRGVPARLHGGELEGRWQLPDGARWHWQALTAVDLVRGERSDTGEPLPRLAPVRWRLGLEAQHEAWRAGGEWRRDAAQTRVSADDTPTPGFNRLRLWASWRQQLGAAEALWMLRVDNLGNTLGYNAAAVSTVRWLSPVPGRSLTASVRVSF